MSTNQRYLWIAVVASIALWIVFKIAYPNANIAFDSYYYIYAALDNDNVSAWPIGYSKFLQLIGLFSHSVNVLTAIQYFFLQGSFLFFFFSMRYLFSLRNWASTALLVFLLLNPIYIYTCNFVLSDAIFLALSLIWLTNLLWILFKPKPWMIITHAVLLLLCFTVRHSALIYPLISCLAFLLSRQRMMLKIAGIVLPCILVAGFMMYTTHLNQSLYGVKQFSPFQSWKVANNALYMYEHVPPKEVEPVPASFAALDKVVHQYFSTRHEPISSLHQDPSSGSYYMFMYPSPLLVYKDMQCGPDRHFLINVRTLAKMGPLYDAYGSYIIKKYPFTYLRYFILPNIWVYLMPWPEIYSDDRRPFILRNDTLGTMAIKWFGKLSLSAPAGSMAFRSALFANYYLLNMYTHLIFLISALLFILLKGFKKVTRPTAKALWLIAALWLINFTFLVIATASLLRYQLFITIVEFAFALFFIDFLLFLERGVDVSLRRGPSVAIGKSIL